MSTADSVTFLVSPDTHFTSCGGSPDIEKNARGIHDMNQRRRLFNKLGCQDMKGLLVTDRGLAVHINRLAKELDVQVPTYPFIPEPPHVSQKVRS